MKYMKIKINKVNNIMDSVIFYIFGVLYLQIVELFLTVSITKFLVLWLLISITYIIVIKRKRVKGTIGISFLFGMFYLVYYFFNLRAIFTYVYPAVIVVIMGLIIIDDRSAQIEHFNWKNINKAVMGYLSINIIFYFFKFSKCFQLAGNELQYRGPLPHTNMFGSVMMSLFLILFWRKEKVACLNKFLIVFLVFTSMSRTYILTILMCVVVEILALFWKRIKFICKLLIGGTTTGVFGSVIFNLAIEYIPFLSRFKNYSFGANGRQYLQESFINTVKSSSIVGKLFGFSMVKSYLDGISVSFSHSFTENSYMGIFLLFGVLGLIICSYMVVKIIKISHSGVCLTILLIVFMSIYTQDTILSVQTGLLLIFSVVCVFSGDVSVKAKAKLNR